MALDQSIDLIRMKIFLIGNGMDVSATVDTSNCLFRL